MGHVILETLSREVEAAIESIQLLVRFVEWGKPLLQSHRSTVERSLSLQYCSLSGEHGAK